MDLQPKPSRKESLSSIATGAQPLSSRSAESSDGSGDACMEAAADGETRGSQVGKRIGKALRIGKASSSSSSSSSTTVHAGPSQHSHSGRRNSPTPSQKKPALMPKPAKQSAAALRSTSRQAASRDRQPTSKTRVEQSPGDDHSPLHRNSREAVDSSPSSARGAGLSCALAEASVCRFPMHALSAINDVLFGRHGYRRMAKHGDPRQAYRLCQCLITLLSCVNSRLLRPFPAHEPTPPVCLDSQIQY